MGSLGNGPAGRIGGVAGHWWAYLWGRLPVERSLRYSLVLGLVATTLVTLLTYLAVGRGSAVEANPLMGWVIQAHGWAAFAAVRYAVVLALFAMVWVVWTVTGREGQWPEWTEGNGRLIAALLWVNAVRDGFVVATGVVPTFVLMRWLGVV